MAIDYPPPPPTEDSDDPNTCLIVNRAGVSGPDALKTTGYLVLQCPGVRKKVMALEKTGGIKAVTTFVVQCLKEANGSQGPVEKKGPETRIYTGRIGSISSRKTPEQQPEWPEQQPEWKDTYKNSQCGQYIWHDVQSSDPDGRYFRVGGENGKRFATLQEAIDYDSRSGTRGLYR